MSAAATDVGLSAEALLSVAGPGEAALPPSAFFCWRASSWSCRELRPDISDLKEVRTAMMDRKSFLSIQRPGKSVWVAGGGVRFSVDCLLSAACLVSRTACLRVLGILQPITDLPVVCLKDERGGGGGNFSSRLYLGIEQIFHQFVGSPYGLI